MSKFIEVSLSEMEECPNGCQRAKGSPTGE